MSRKTNEKPPCPALRQCIDIELAERSDSEIAGAYQALCAMMLLRTACVVGKSAGEFRNRKIEVTQKLAAERWLEGRLGLVTFEEVCAAFDLDPEYGRDRIYCFAESDRSGAINKAKKPKVHMIFGRRNARSSSLTSGQTQDHH